MRLKLILTLIFISLFITGCGLSDDTIGEANSAKQLYKTAEKAYNDKKTKFEKFKKTSDFKKFINYHKVENWDEEFINAKSYIDIAKQLDRSLTKLLEEDDSDKESTIKRKVVDLKRQTMDASKYYNKVQKRINFITKVMKDAPDIYKNSISRESEINTIYTSLAEHFEITKKDYPKKSSDLDGRLIAVKKVKNDSSNLLAIVRKEFAKKDTNRNYALLGDSGKAITANLKKIQDMNKSLRKKTGELYKSYAKILKDMKVDIYIVVGRASWDSNDDWDNSPDYTYRPKLVDEETAKYFETLNASIATYGIGWGSNLEVKISQTMWNKLGISAKESWPSRHGDDEAEYWVQDIKYKFYHKYILIENDKSKKTDWIEVSENVFNANEANLGMEIVSKPYGFYESEKVKTAAPPGMSTVGNPKYGEWKQDNSGNSFFHYYGMYSFITGGNDNRYYRSDYDNYNNNRRNNTSYYGSKKQYGSGGSATSSRFKSNYVKKNYTGSRSSTSRSTRTSRSSGSNSRGRGPGGGGK